MAKYIVRMFPREWLLEMLWGHAPAGASIISNDIVDTSRWSVIHALVFKFDDKFYSTDYRTGATEYQDESPWENESDVECTEVEPVEVVRIEYQPKKGD